MRAPHILVSFPDPGPRPKSLCGCRWPAVQSARRPQFPCPRGSESRTRKLRLHYGDFVQEKFNMADKIAGKLEMALRVNKVSAKAFEPRTS